MGKETLYQVYKKNKHPYICIILLQELATVGVIRLKCYL